jgi:hypothetical protein
LSRWPTFSKPSPFITHELAADEEDNSFGIMVAVSLIAVLFSGKAHVYCVIVGPILVVLGYTYDIYAASPGPSGMAL